MPARLPVHVTPKGGRDEAGGWRDGELQVRVRAAAEGGKANAAVCALIAKALRVPKSSVTVVRGDTARHKLLELSSATDEDVERVFGRPDAAV